MYGLGDLIDELRADIERLQRENDALRRDAERWRHAKTDFLVASEVEAIDARIDAGISARKETT